MASAGGVGTVLPLWRIHNFSSKGAGDTVNIINIARPDTIALLNELSGGYGPIWAAGKIALAANYSTEPSTLEDATLVRIKEVSASKKPGTYNAELLVLCKTRVLNVSTRKSFPTARRGPDLAPLWRIHNIGFVGDPDFDTKRTEYKIGNIAREDTLALLKKLGDGDVKRAKGHLVLVCDFKAQVAAGLHAILVRIGDVTCAAGGQPSLNCTLNVFGHVRCAEVDCRGSFPQVLLDEVPVWRIHNLDKGSSSEHKIFNIARPDSVALLKHLGQGNPLSASGGLVVGCDYDSPPAIGESGKLMRVSSISHASEEGKYEAVLVDVSTVTVGQFRSNVGKAEDWWPRLTVLLPKIWGRPTELVEPPINKPSTPAAVTCPYWQRCQKVLSSIMRDAGLQLSEYVDPVGNKCFCSNCHRSRGDQLVYRRGGQSYVLPINFARIGIKPGKSHGLVENGMKNWHVCYHGTKYQYLSDILIQGQLLAPGSTLHNGDSIQVRPGHIDRSFNRTNQHTGEKEVFDPTNKVFFSPSIKYCDNGVYTNEYHCNGSHYRFALQLRIQPNTYKIGQETIGATEEIDPNISNKSIEWYADQTHTHFFTGILVREK